METVARNSHAGALVIVMILTWYIPNEVKQQLLERSQLLLEYFFSFLFKGADFSLQKSLELLKQGLVMLKEHWLIGYFMGKVFDIWKRYYIHYWLSFWLAYGIDPFLSSIWFLLALTFKVWRGAKRSLESLIALSLLAFIRSSISLVRPYVRSYFWQGLNFVEIFLDQGYNRKKRKCAFFFSEKRAARTWF